MGISMRGILVLGAIAFLGGCATYSAGDVPQAGQAYRLAIDRCNANMGQMRGVRDGMECILAADRQFAIAVKLRKMDLYENFAARERLLAAEIDNGHIPVAELEKRYTDIRMDYYQAVGDAQERGRQQAAALAAGMAAAGQSMQREADRQAYIQANRQQPFNCTSTAFGSTIQTNCH